MESEKRNRNTTLAALIHISTFSKYLIPLGNFIFPLIIWLSNKSDKWLDEHGRQAINFQISLFLYYIFTAFVSVGVIVFLAIQTGEENTLLFSEAFFENEVFRALPILIAVGIAGMLLLGLFVLELVCVITASLRAGEGNVYKYPFSIQFIPVNRKGQD